MASQIDPSLPEETSGPNIGKVLIARLRQQLTRAKTEIEQNQADIEQSNNDIAGLQNAVQSLTTTNVAEGANNKYFTLARVRDTVIEGLSLAEGSAITAADSVLSALGKLQKQISTHFTADDPHAGYAKGLTNAEGYLNALINRDGSVSTFGAKTNYSYGCWVLNDTINNEFVDTSGKSNHIQVESANSDAFANTGYATTKAVASGGLVIPTSELTIDMSKDSGIFRVVLNGSAPAANAIIFAIAAANAVGSYGFYGSLRTNGKLKIAPIVNGLQVNASNDTSQTFTNESGPVALTIAWDAPSGSFFIYKDEKLIDVFAHLVNGLMLTPSVQMPVRFGGLSDVTSTVAMQFGGTAHLLKFENSGLPVNVNSIVKLLGKSNTPITFDKFRWPRKRLLAAVDGQSNEGGPLGGSPDYIAFNHGDGCPARDSSGYLNNGKNTCWPKLAQFMGARDVWFQVANTAVGATAQTDTWVGKLRAYQAGMAVTKGSYVIDANGRVYKAVGTLGAIYVLDVTPSNGVGGSNLTGWTNLGLASDLGAQYVAGYVCKMTDALFDPNGLCLAAKNAVYGKKGYDVLAVIISIGQSDKTVNDTSAQYQAGIEHAAAYYTSFGLTVIVDMTISAASVNDFFISTLLPGRAAALNNLKSNPLVLPGADLTTLIGVLPQETNLQPAAMLPTPAIQNNAGSFVHANAVAQTLCAKYRDQEYKKIGL